MVELPLKIDMSKLLAAGDSRPDTSYYNDIWRSIHNLAKRADLTGAQTLLKVREIINNKLNVVGCFCRKDALLYLDILVNFDDSYLDSFTVAAREKFFCHFHNLVNIKLNKPFFVYGSDNLDKH